MRTTLILTAIVTSLFSLSSFGSTIKSAVLFDGRVIDLNTDVINSNYYQERIDYLELQSGEIVDRTDIKKFILSNRLPNQNSRSRIGVDGGGT
jgi:hypothetical protein